MLSAYVSIQRSWKIMQVGVLEGLLPVTVTTVLVATGLSVDP
jgi:hypothetical protein